MELAEGVHRVALALTPQLQIRDLGARCVGKGQLRHPQAILRRRAALGQGLVGRDARGDHQGLVGLKGLPGGTKSVLMAQMGRVEAPAVEEDPHAYRFRSFTRTIVGFSGFWRNRTNLLPITCTASA